MQKVFLAVAATIISTAVAVGCAPIEQSKSVETQYNARKYVGVGDLVYSSEKRKSMPNIFGKADLFGRTTIAGRTTVVFAGVKQGSAYFARKSVDIDSGETTMNSSGPIVIPNTNTTYHTGNVGGVTYSGTSYSDAPPTVIMPDKPQAKYMSRGTQWIAVDLTKLPQTFIVEGDKVTVFAADNLKAEILVSK